MNWPDLLNELLRLRHPDGRAVWTCASIAKHCGCTRVRIGQIRMGGTEPSWSVGNRLIALQKESKFSSE